jgi:hypothetical protein
MAGVRPPGRKKLGSFWMSWDSTKVPWSSMAELAEVLILILGTSWWLVVSWA